MNVYTDDDIYRVDAIWLGPPGATMPWRARYIAWGIGLVATLVVLTTLRLWFPFGFFTVAWSIVMAVGITRLIGKKITHERPMRDVVLMAARELTTPRRATAALGGAADPRAVRMRAERPHGPARPRTHSGQESPRA